MTVLSQVRSFFSKCTTIKWVPFRNLKKGLDTQTNRSPFSQYRIPTRTFPDVIKGSSREKNNVLPSNANRHIHRLLEEGSTDQGKDPACTQEKQM